jgi:hypothetical protein
MRRLAFPAVSVFYSTSSALVDLALSLDPLALEYPPRYVKECRCLSFHCTVHLSIRRNGWNVSGNAASVFAPSNITSLLDSPLVWVCSLSVGISIGRRSGWSVRKVFWKDVFGRRRSGKDGGERGIVNRGR